MDDMPEMLFHGTLYLELQKESGKVLPAGESKLHSTKHRTDYTYVLVHEPVSDVRVLFTYIIGRKGQNVGCL